MEMPLCFSSSSSMLRPRMMFSSRRSFLNHCLILVLAEPLWAIFSQSLLGPGADFENDALGRSYLKDFVYYDMVHRYEEFLQNYGPDIRAWQLSEVVADAT